MLTRWSLVVMVGCGASTTTKVDTPNNVAETPAATSKPAVVEGYVRDKRTGKTVPGIEVEAWLGAVTHGRVGAKAISDERGFFRLDVEPGTGFVFVEPGEIDDAPNVAFRAGELLRMDLTVDPDEVARMRAEDPPIACPSSPPGTIVEGHTTTQQDLDDVARAVLERAKLDRNAIPDHHVAERDGAPIAVRMDVGPRKQLTAKALPTSGLVLATLADLQREADRLGKRIGFLELRDVYSNGSCAVLWVGGDYVTPSKQPQGKLCCCTAHDLYEKRGTQWVFIRRVSEICA